MSLNYWERHAAPCMMAAYNRTYVQVLVSSTLQVRPTLLYPIVVHTLCASYPAIAYPPGNYYKYILVYTSTTAL